MLNRKTFLYAGKVLLGLLLLAWLFWQVDCRQIYSSFGNGDPVFLVCGILAMSLAFVGMQTLRLHALVGDITVSYKETLKIVLISLFMDQFLPSSVGGDAYRIFHLRNIGNCNWARPVTLSFIDRFVGMGTLFFAGMIYLFMRGSSLLSRLREISSVSLSGLHMPEWFAVSVALTLIPGLCFRSKIKTWWRKILNFLKECKTEIQEVRLPVWLWVIFVSICFHVLRAVGFYYFVLYFNEYISLVDLIFVLFFTAFVSIVPVTIGGLGLIEGATAFSLVLFGVTGSSAVAIAFLNRLVWIAYAAIGGVWFILAKK